MNLLSAIVVIAALVGIYRSFARWPLDIVGVFCLDFMLFYGFRVVVVGTGIDTPYPDEQFTGAAPIVTVNVMLAVFLGMVAVGLVVGRATRLQPAGLVPRFRAPLDVGRGLVVAAGLTALASAITLALMVQYGGFGGLVRAGKLERDLAGLFFLRIVPGMGALVAAGTFLELVRRRGGRRMRGGPRLVAAACAAMAVVNGIWVFAWGARSLLAVVAFVLLAGYVAFRVRPGTVLGADALASTTTGATAVRRARRRWRSQVLRGLVGVAIVALGLIVGLRVARDLVSRGELNETIADEAVVRQVSVAANTTYYDASMLAMRDWPARHGFRGGEDFVNGAAGVVPRAIWPEKPEVIVPGAWFRQIYEPEVRNGWPMGSAGEWYLNFGWIGVVSGGLVSGVVLAWVQGRLRHAAESPMAFVTTLIVGLQVIEIGVNTQSALRWVSWCLPLFLLAPLLRRRSLARGATAGSPPPLAAPDGPTPEARAAPV